MTVKIIGYIVVGILVTLAALQINSWREKSLKLDQLQRAGARTAAIISDAKTTANDRRRAESHVRNIQESYDASLQQAIIDDPEVAARGAQRVPPRLLELARERRIARERLGCATSDCGRGTSPEAVE